MIRYQMKLSDYEIKDERARKQRDARYKGVPRGEAVAQRLKGNANTCASECFAQAVNLSYSRRELNSYALRREFFASFTKSRLARCGRAIKASPGGKLSHSD